MQQGQEGRDGIKRKIRKKKRKEKKDETMHIKKGEKILTIITPVLITDFNNNDKKDNENND